MVRMSSLYIWIPDPEQRALMWGFARRSTDSGVDIMLPQNVTVGARETQKIDLGIVVAATMNPRGAPLPCLLVPRSSMSKTPLRLANSIGLIDAGYRGPVGAMVDNISSTDFTANKGDRLFQICSHNFLPFANVVFVDTLENLPAPPDTRGAGGFGSTGQ